MSSFPQGVLKRAVRTSLSAPASFEGVAEAHLLPRLLELWQI